MLKSEKVFKRLLLKKQLLSDYASVQMHRGLVLTEKVKISKSGRTHVGPSKNY